MSDPSAVSAEEEQSGMSPEIREWFRQIDYWQPILEERLPEIDPLDLRMILRANFQPPSVPRKWLLRKTMGQGYVF